MSNASDPPRKFYRYDDRVYAAVSFDVSGVERYYTTPVQLECSEFDLVKETRCGYWIRGNVHCPKFWVSKRSKKRHAHPSKAQALESFLIRKERQAGIYQARLNRAMHAMELAKLEKEKLAA